MKTNLEKMISNWYLGGSDSDATFILNEVGFAMKDGMKILLPYITPGYENGTVTPYQLTAADFFSGNPDIVVKPVEITTDDEQNWIVCGLNKDVLQQKGYEKCLSFGLKEVVDLIMECKQLDGLVLVAEGAPVYLAKITLEALSENDPASYVTPIKCDITKLEVDAIVNAANVSLLGGGGVDGAIHKAAGPELLEECKGLYGCQTGDAKITKGYNLPAKHVIHTVGPVYTGKDTDQYQLNSCYIKSLDLALENGCRSIAFPCISSGVYGYPLNESIPIAVLSVLQWFQNHPEAIMEVYLCCFDDQAYDLYNQFFKYVIFPDREDVEHKVDVHRQ